MYKGHNANSFTYQPLFKDEYKIWQDQKTNTR